MKPWTPSFDPMIDTLSLAPVWVRLPNLPFAFLGFTSLEPLANPLENSITEALKQRTTTPQHMLQICVEMDFSKGFPT
jgi:hypothetical protein